MKKNKSITGSLNFSTRYPFPHLEISKKATSYQVIRSTLIGLFFVPFFTMFFFSASLWAEETLNEQLEQELKWLEAEFYDYKKVTTASRHEEDVDNAPANITVITPEIIERRGYQNLVEILEDLPGFDFATYEDGGGEYPTHSLNRGIGGNNGNSKLLIMVDEIIQNHISFNWSMGWGNQLILNDIERIEIIQGPGSALYGSNSLSGIVHIITRKKRKKDHEIYIKPWVGEDGAKAVDVNYGGKKNNLHYSLALRKYNTDGNGGEGRPDPGNYFHNNVEPNILTQDYDSDGNYVTDVTNPTAGRSIPDGFNTSKDDLALRGNLFFINQNKDLKFGIKKAGIGFSYWDKEDGLGSYVTGYEYFAADPGFITHQRAYHIFGTHEFQITHNLEIKSSIWYRANQQMPDTGFAYTYRYNDLTKTYNSSSKQAAIEEQLHWTIKEDSNLIVGYRYMDSDKMGQVISLGQEQSAAGTTTTTSSWDLANAGNGLYQSKTLPVYSEKENALYAVYDNRINSYFSYSLGTRYDNSTEFGNTLNPRLGLITRLPVEKLKIPVKKWGIKFLYGTAFRQASIFELQDEFRGNAGLVPEKIATYEIENNVQVFSDEKREYFDSLNVKFNFFYSKQKDIISLVTDSSSEAGERYNNTGKFEVSGFSTNLDMEATKKLSFYFNYIYTLGKEEGAEAWTAIDHTAKHKFNAGFNFLTLYDHLNVNFRLNHVGKRKVPSSNSYFTDLAPGYTKANLVLTGKNIRPKWLKGIKIEPQFLVKNLFNLDYYGVGRQAGSSNRDKWDADTNPNPPGFIPPYHPQPGRKFLFNLKITF